MFGNSKVDTLSSTGQQHTTLWIGIGALNDRGVDGEGHRNPAKPKRGIGAKCDCARRSARERVFYNNKHLIARVKGRLLLLRGKVERFAKNRDPRVCMSGRVKQCNDCYDEAEFDYFHFVGC